jgi:phosphoribosyl-ATP pyrophosphohydrolase/phosphoribosyl-AMP cyclohydrolase
MLTVPTLSFPESGLIAVVLQHADTGEVLTVAWTNAEAVHKTAASGQTWLWSRSRQELWHKGATSGHTQTVVQMGTDCDADALVYRVVPDGPACHLGTRSCFSAPPTLQALDDTLVDRAVNPSEGSYTTKLLTDRNLRLKKLGEEAVELSLACADGADEDVVYETADLLYHALGAARARGVSVADVLAELRRRQS